MLNLRLNSTNKLLWTLLGFALLGGVSYLDFLTGYKIELNLLYSIPVLVITWFTSWRLGLVLAFLSPIMLLLVRLFVGYYYDHWFYYFLNPLLKFFILASFAYLVQKSKEYLARAKELACTDDLTGAGNRRFFIERLQVEIDRSRRDRHPFTVAYLDLDNFKAINDRFGHAAGDGILRAIVIYIKNNLRKIDLVARLGGDEFALLLPETGQEQAQIVVSKIRQGLLDEMKKNNRRITFSIGVLTCMGDPPVVNEIVRIADELMYTVKNRDKNEINYSVYTG